LRCVRIRGINVERRYWLSCGASHDWRLGALLITVTTGIYNSLNWLWQPTEITGTTYGLSLIYKMLLVFGLLAVGAIHHVAARPERYAALSGRVNWRLTLPLETVLVLFTLIAAGFVSATPIPTPDFAENDIPAPRATTTVADLTVEKMLSPGGLGVNTYDTRISVDETPLENVTVFVRMVNPTADTRGDWHEAEVVEPGLYVTAGDEFDAEGRWLSLVDVVDTDGNVTRAVYEWDISDDASVIESVPPRIQHWLALGAVITALVWVVRPSYIAFMQRMTFTATTASIVAVAVVGTAVITFFGFQYIADLQARNAALLNPPPSVVNTVLPDMASLARGEALYAEYCTWGEEDRTFTSLVERLSRTRDDELFSMISEGWRDLPACTLEGDDSVWDMVNYIRTFERR
jgi:hypothetical protein